MPVGTASARRALRAGVRIPRETHATKRPANTMPQFAAMAMISGEIAMNI